MLERCPGKASVLLVCDGVQGARGQHGAADAFGDLGLESSCCYAERTPRVGKGARSRARYDQSGSQSRPVFRRHERRFNTQRCRSVRRIKPQLAARPRALCRRGARAASQRGGLRPEDGIADHDPLRDQKCVGVSIDVTDRLQTQESINAGKRPPNRLERR